MLLKKKLSLANLSKFNYYIFGLVNLQNIMKFDDYFSKYLDNKQLHVKCKENLKESNIISLKFTFLLRTYGLHFANPKICFNCHKTYLTLYKIIENNLKNIIILMLEYNTKL